MYAVDVTAPRRPTVAPLRNPGAMAPSPYPMPASIAAGRSPAPIASGQVMANPGVQAAATVAPAPQAPVSSMAPIAYAMSQYQEPGDPFTAAAQGLIYSQQAREQQVSDQAKATEAAKLIGDHPDIKRAVETGVLTAEGGIAMGQKRDELKAAAQATAQEREQILYYLTLSGDDDIAAMFKSGVITKDDIPNLLAEKDKKPTLTDDQRKLAQINEERAAAGQPPLSLEEFLAGKKSGLTVNVGPNGVDYGDPGAGLVWQRSPEGEIVLDDRGAPIAIPFQGGKPYEEMLARDAKLALGDAREDVKSAVVVQDIDRALDAIVANPMLTTGIGAQLTGGLGGSPALDVSALIDTVKANAGFKELQAMRESSPTGGALGNITEKEIAYLQATIGNLSVEQSSEQLIDNLKRVKNTYLDIIHGEGNGPPREVLSFEDATPPASPTTPAGGLTDLSDEELMQMLDR